jgi:hypothetical protein
MGRNIADHPLWRDCGESPFVRTKRGEQVEEMAVDFAE